MSNRKSAPPLSPASLLRLGIIRRVLDDEGVSSILEIGTGMGGAAWQLAQGRVYRGYEPDELAFATAEERLRELPDARILNAFPPEADRTFDAVVAFEVLEHIEDDYQALIEWREWLAEGGLLLISVPAKERRFSSYDVEVGHHRRYERDQLLALLNHAGFERVVIRSYGMPLGYLLEWVRNKVLARRLDDLHEEDKSARSGRSFQPKSFGGILRAVIWPFQILQRPFENTDLGIGYVASGRIHK